MIEHLNKIDVLASKIAAMLDMMQFADGNVDIESINLCAVMCITNLHELMQEVEKIGNEWNADNERKKNFIAEQ